jgi:hypothetical protein
MSSWAGHSVLGASPESQKIRLSATPHDKLVPRGWLTTPASPRILQPPLASIVSITSALAVKFHKCHSPAIHSLGTSPAASNHAFHGNSGRKG